MHHVLTATALILLLSLMACGGGECDGLDRVDCLENDSCEAEYETVPCFDPPCEEAFVVCVVSSDIEDAE